MFVSGDLALLEGRMSNKVRGLRTRGSISQYKNYVRIPSRPRPCKDSHESVRYLVYQDPGWL